MELEHLWILVSEWVLEPIVHGNGGNDCKYRDIEIEKKIKRYQSVNNDCSGYLILDHNLPPKLDGFFLFVCLFLLRPNFIYLFGFNILATWHVGPSLTRD